MLLEIATKPLQLRHLIYVKTGVRTQHPLIVRYLCVICSHCIKISYESEESVNAYLLQLEQELGSRQICVLCMLAYYEHAFCMFTVIIMNSATLMNSVKQQMLS